MTQKKKTAFYDAVVQAIEARIGVREDANGVVDYKDQEVLEAVMFAANNTDVEIDEDLVRGVWSRICGASITESAMRLADALVEKL